MENTIRKYPPKKTFSAAKATIIHDPREGSRAIIPQACPDPFSDEGEATDYRINIRILMETGDCERQRR